MNTLKEILDYNKTFVKNKDYKDYITSKMPNKNLVVLSCMDTRLTELLPKALNIKNGDAKIIKNAGATIVHPFGSIMRSLILAIYEFNSSDILVIGHYGCGMCGLNSENIIQKVKERGISDDTFKTIKNSGIDIEKWLTGFNSIEDSILESVNLIRNHPLVPNNVNIHGLIMDPETGEIELLEKEY